MTAPLLTYQHAGMYVDIHYDPDAGDPRADLDNLGTIVGWKQPDLTIGDRQVSIEFTTPAEIVAALRKEGARLILPVFYTSHGPRCNLHLGDAADEDSLGYCSGVVFGFVIHDHAGTEWESGWGFYGRQDCEHDANEAAESSAERKQAEAEEAHQMACRDIPTVAA